ncbi:MAG: cell division protein FtsA [Beijerinckiaceae bacterium]|nr:cell division protein FtsA [Beijerinckiaceae bacterium]
MSAHTLSPPHVKALNSRRSANICVLDVGTTKVVCLIGKLTPLEGSDLLRGRTHRCKVLGIGVQRARGIKGGTIVDMEEAENAIRHAVDAAERMSKLQVESVIVNLSGGRLGSRHLQGSVGLTRAPVEYSDIQRVIHAASGEMSDDGRPLLHSIPTSYHVDGGEALSDPKGLAGAELAARMHVVSCEPAALRNIMLAVERCHLEVEGVVASPYASGLSVLVEDEAEMGTIVVDFGGGTTSAASFSHGRIQHCDAIAVGGNHVSMDIARGLTLRLDDAERLKTHYGACLSTTADERETISIVPVGEENTAPRQLPKMDLVKIIRPRIEEILELVRDRLAAHGYPAHGGHRVVLTGGGALLPGLTDVAKRILSNQVRIGRPLGVQGLPESAKSPAFAAAAGLLVYPQVAGLERFDRLGSRALLATGTDGYVSRVGRWLKESF